MHAYACRQRKRYREAEKHLTSALAEARRMALPAAAALSAQAGAASAPKHPRLHGAGAASARTVVHEGSARESPPGSPGTSAGSASDQSASMLLGLARPSGGHCDAASTAASTQFASATEEVQQLVFRATVELARCCFEQGRLQEAVRTPSGCASAARRAYFTARNGARVSRLPQCAVPC